MATKKIEIQDSNGNVYYPHTDASVVKNGSKTVAEQLKDITQKVKNIDGRNAVATDANNLGIAGQETVDITNGNTLNTPYKEGLVGGLVAGLIVTYLSSTTYGIQIYYQSGSTRIFSRQFNSGIWGNWTEVTTQDTGWIDLTLNSGFTARYTPKIRKIGKMVFIKGQINANSLLTTAQEILTIPSGFRPATDLHECTSSISDKNIDIWINTSGVMYAKINTVATGGYVYFTDITAWLID